MIGRLAGTYAGAMEEGCILVDVRGVGYVVRMTPFEQTPNEGDSLELFIHTAVREDAIDLYGFPSRRSLSFFKLLMSVSGVGPKSALSIISSADTPSLARAIAAGDLPTLIKVFGIGKKTAERLVVELKDKAGKMAISETAGTPAHGSSDADILEALEALGYSVAESRRALQSVPDTGSDMRERLAAVLKQLGKPRG